MAKDDATERNRSNTVGLIGKPIYNSRTNLAPQFSTATALEFSTAIHRQTNYAGGAALVSSQTVPEPTTMALAFGCL